MDIIDQLSSAFEEKGIKITLGSHDGSKPGGGKLFPSHTAYHTSLTMTRLLLQLAMAATLPYSKAQENTSVF